MANEGLVIDVDYNITKAEAKTRKLNREFDISKQKVENINSKIKELNNSLEEEKNKQKELRTLMEDQTKEAAELARQIDRVQNGDASMQEIIDLGSIDTAKAKLNEMEKEIKDNERAFDKSSGVSKKITSELATQNLALKKQHSETANIGYQILLNGKKQNKFTQAFEKSTKSADRFGKRLKSLIASALFFSLVTKAFTALRNEFGKLITETGTKTAKLVSQLNGNLAVIGRTLYESARPAIEWLLQKLVDITNIITYGIAKTLGKSVEEMRKLVAKSKELNKNVEKASKPLASFDEINVLSKSDAESKDTVTTSQHDVNVNANVNDKELDKLKEKLDTILLTAGLIALAFSAWKITGFLTQLGAISPAFATILTGIFLCALGMTGLTVAAVNWKEGLHNGENTMSAILGTVSAILLMIVAVAIGIAAWPVLIIGALAIGGMWIDNFKDKIDKWLESLPAGIYDLFSIIITAAYGVWDFIKNLLKGIYEIFTGDWETGLKRIGTALLNLLIDGANIFIDAVNFVVYPIRLLIAGIGKVMNKNWSIKDISIPHIPRFPQLATGAVLPGGSPMLAWVNDQPKGQPYVEGSVENITAAFEKYLSGKNFGGGDVNINFTGSLSRLAQILQPEVTRENKRKSIFA